MFDPSIGRWFGEDPIDFGAGDANLYRYVGNSPTNATDPSGLALQKVEVVQRPIFPYSAFDHPQWLRNEYRLEAMGAPIHTAPSIDIVKRNIREDAAAVISRLRVVKEVIDDALRDDSEDDWSPTKVLEMPQVKAKLTSVHHGGLFSTEYRFALENVAAGLDDMLKYTSQGFNIRYWEYGTETAKGKKVLPGLWGWTLETAEDEYDGWIHITEEGWNPKVHNNSLIGGDPNKTLGPVQQQNARRGTILHELSHLVLYTRDFHLHYNDNQTVLYREIWDAYWWQLFYHSSSTKADVDSALGHIVADILRPGYAPLLDRWHPIIRPEI